MKILLYYGQIESLNHFTDELNVQFLQMGHQTYIFDLNQYDSTKLEMILKEGIDVAVCYDCIGTFTQYGGEGIYNSLGITVVNILMDHPMNMDYCMRKAPQKYIQLSPDENHVKYAKEFFDLENVYFAPHMASVSYQMKQEIVNKDISVLFPGAMIDCNDILEKIKCKFAQNELPLGIAMEMLEILLEDSALTLEEALYSVLNRRSIQVPTQTIAVLMSQFKEVDHFVRMYYRGCVVSKIAEAGIPMTLIGRGWEQFFHNSIPKSIQVNPGITFGEVFEYMERAEITLTVMPWFKAGTHDRIFNSLLHNSCPLTDESSWLLEHLVPDEDCAYYSLKNLNELPWKVFSLLNHPEEREKIIRNGSKKVWENYTSEQIAKQIIDSVLKLNTL